MKKINDMITNNTVVGIILGIVVGITFPYVFSFGVNIGKIAYHYFKQS